jgi:hypothetical protein|tara:strand:+ start:37 stop:237 length:201 start_codon:yes stop_codon:yes gene_type:complete
MKSKGQGKKDYVVVIKDNNDSRRVFSHPVTSNQAVALINGSSLPLDFVAIRHIETLGILPNKTQKA